MPSPAILNRTRVFQLPSTGNFFGIRGAVPETLPMVSQELASPTRDWIERQFALFGTIIPASTADTTRRRTSYFYRQEAIHWARMARQDWPTATFAEICARNAKSYLSKYRALKSAGHDTPSILHTGF
jgi:hypothetical protein